MNECNRKMLLQQSDLATEWRLSLCPNGDTINDLTQSINWPSLAVAPFRPLCIFGLSLPLDTQRARHFTSCSIGQSTLRSRGQSTRVNKHLTRI